MSVATVAVPLHTRDIAKGGEGGSAGARKATPTHYSRAISSKYTLLCHAMQARWHSATGQQGRDKTPHTRFEGRFGPRHSDVPQDPDRVDVVDAVEFLVLAVRAVVALTHRQ